MSKEIEFVPVYSTKAEIESALRETVKDRDDEASADEAADEAERSMFDKFEADTKAKLREDEASRSFDRESRKHIAEMRVLNKPRPPSVDTTGYVLLDCTCQCCRKSFRSLHARELCSKKCAAKGPAIIAVEDKTRELICQYSDCGKTFRSKRLDARFCPGGACQKAAKRAELSRTILCEAA